MENKMKIMIVDDNRINRIILRRQLVDIYEICEAENGMVAWQMAETMLYPPDMILLDLQMPVMDGYEFLAKRQNHPFFSKIPLIVLTSDKTKDAESKALSLGANDILYQPFKPTIIRLRIANLLKMVAAVASQEEIATIINHIPCGIIVYEIDGDQIGLRYVNDAISAISGYSETEYRKRFGEDATQIMMAEDWQSLKDDIQLSFRHNEPVDIEFRAYTKDGNIRWRHLQAKYAGMDGRKKIYFGVTTDVDRAKKNELLTEAQRRDLETTNEKMQLVLQYSKLGIAEYNVAGRTMTLKNVTDDSLIIPQEIYHIDEFISQSIFSREVQKKLTAFFEGIDAGVVQQEMTIPVNKGRYWLKINFHTIFNEDNEPIEAIGNVRNITEEVHLRQEYEKEKQLRIVQGDDAIISFESDIETGKIANNREMATYIMPSCYDYLSFFKGLSAKLIHPDDRKHLAFLLDSPRIILFVKAGNRELYTEVRMKSFNGHYDGYQWRSITNHFITNPGDGNIHAFVYIRDIHARKVEEINNKELAQRDAMTGLLNRITFEKYVTKSLRKMTSGSCSAFLIMDIDDFKGVNDTCGHLVGDEVLQFMATQLRCFFTNIPNAKIAMDKGQAFCEAMKQWSHKEGLQVTCSVGIAMAPQHGTAFDILYQRADNALYKAKENGKNQCCVYDTMSVKSNLASWMDKNYIVDAFDETVYISDIKTYDLLYMNRKAMEQFHVTKRDIGRKCYAVLQGLSEPCSFCNNHLLSYQDFYIWKHTNQKIKETALLKDKLIEWDGRPARMEIAMNLTDDVQKKLNVKEADQQARIDAQRYQFLLEHTDLMPFEYDPQMDTMRYVYKDRNGKIINRVKPNYLSGLSQSTVIHGDDQARCQAAAMKAMATQMSGTLDFKADFMGEGEYRPYQLDYASLADAFGSVYHISGRITPMRKQVSDLALASPTKQQRPVILIVDDEATNREILKNIFEKRYEILEAENGEEAIAALNKRKDIYLVMLDLVMPKMDGFGVLRYIKTTPFLRYLTVLVCTAYGNEDNVMRALSLGAYDILTKPYNYDIVRHRVDNLIEKQLLLQDNRRFQYDALTGIFNREAFYRAVRHFIQDNPSEKFVMIASNIRHFKLINELFGTGTGDQVLRDNASLLASFKNEISYVHGRIQSDLFASFMLKRDVEKIDFSAFSSGVLHKSTIDFEYTRTFGIYEVDDTSIAVDTMWGRAKEAMSSVVNDYIKPYAFYDHTLGLRIKEEQSMTSEMKPALESHQFKVYYQPVYDAKTNECIAAEALVRWHRLDGKMASPGLFIPLFEHNGFIGELDRYVLGEVCALLTRRLAKGQEVVPVSVNLSRVDFFKVDLADVLESIVDSYKLPHNLIRFEVTESAYADNADQLIAIVRQLQEKGFDILMDDFGSGYSSFNALKDIPVDIIKIDLRFLEGMEDPSQYASQEDACKSAKIVTAIINMAKCLGLDVVAEGVENEHQLAFLTQSGCHNIQGFYFSRPVNEDAFEEKLNQSSERR